MDLYYIIYWIGLILFGGYFVYNGFRHFQHHASMTSYATAMGVPQAGLAVYVGGALLLLGGLGLIFHFYTSIALWMLVVFLVPVTFKMHAYWKMSDPAMKMSNQINFYKNLGLLGAVLLLIGLIR